MDYELYHDESQEDGYWHGMLLVPALKKDVLLRYLKSVRENVRHNDVLSIKRVKSKGGKVFRCARAWINMGVGALIQDLKGTPYPIYTEREWSDKYGLLEDLIGAKFILFKERDSHKKMLHYSDHAAKIETTFRMGLKGGLHLLGSSEQPICITKIHFDGYEHYRRRLDKERIIERINGLREYCSFVSDDDLIDDRTGNHDKTDSQDYNDCQLLQLTDLMVGGFRTVLGEQTREIHAEISIPIKKIIEKYACGPARMKNSRWCSGFCMSQCHLDEDSWHFDSLISEGPNERQKRLF